MTSRSKIKGSTWERTLCKFLSETLGGNFMRTPNSGAYIGRSNSHRKQQMSASQILAAKGDIIPPDTMKKMVVEAKSYKNFPFHQLLTGQCRQLDEWISQTLDCVDEGDVWFTIFKIDRTGSFVAYPSVYDAHFQLTDHCHYTLYTIVEMTQFFRSNAEAIRHLCRT